MSDNDELAKSVEELHFEDSFPYFGGRQVEVAALSKVLAFSGIRAAHSQQPFSEPMLFGLGGGIGLGYFVYESENFVSMFLGTRFMTQETPQTGFIHSICDRLGIPTVLQMASGTGAAERKLAQALDQERVVIVYVDPRLLPYYGTPNAYHALVVYGYDPTRARYLVSDRSSMPISLAASELSHARQGEGAAKARALTVEQPTVLAPLPEAIKESILQCCAQMSEGFGPPNFRRNFGLAALQKWADLLVEPRDKRGWPRFFPAGERLFAAQVSAFEQIENRSLQGAALRPLYADFLDEASQILTNQALSEAASQMRTAGDLWRVLAEAVLPGSVAPFAETRRLLTLKKELFETKGLAGMEESHSAELRLAELRSKMSHEYPLEKQAVKDLFDDLRSKILQIHTLETEIIASLQAALTPG